MAESTNLMYPTFTNILHISRSNLQARLYNLDIISNDLANVNTTGYKSARGNFQELLNDSLQNSGVKLDSTQRIMTQGSMQDSDSPYHIAIQGDGFFAVTLPDGRTAYTRDGTFGLDANRKIVNANGYLLLWSGQIPANTDEVQVTPAGHVMVHQNGTWTDAGTIKLYRFANPSGFSAYGKNQFLATDSSGAAQAGNPGAGGYGEVISYMKENSNVNLGEEMTDMIITQRGFQVSMRAFQQTDQMLSLALALRR